MLYSNLDVSEMFVDRQAQRSSMHARHLNEQLVRVLKTIGYDVGFQKGQGQYLYDREGARYLDLLSGFGVFAIGRNHPALRQALKSVLDSDLPNLVQLDVSTLAGVLAERLLKFVPYLDKVFFANSGAECVEAAIKFARGATGRPGIVYCAHAFHGLSYGALSLTDDPNFRAGFEPLLPGCTSIPFNDLAALEQALSSREVAAFIVEPIQGKGVNMPTDEFLPGAAALCRKYGTLLVADEIQTGIGRTGKLFHYQHAGIEPDIMTLGKGIGGGVPLAALLATEAASCFEHGDQGGTFNGNPLMCAAGLAVMRRVADPDFLRSVTDTGLYLESELQRMSARHGLGEVRGCGLLLALDLKHPIAASIVARAFQDGVLLNAPRPDTLRFMPALNVTREEIALMIDALDAVLAKLGAARRVA